MPDPETIAFYERSAPRLTFSPGQAPSRDLDPFLDLLPSGGDVLELGCGTGRDAARMVERGFRVDATDGAAAIVRKANERYDIGARQMLFEELDAEDAYDAVWAHASLLHVPRSDLSVILGRIHRALRPGGWHYASYKLGNAEGRCLLGRLHNFPAPDWLIEQHRSASFEIADQRIWKGDGADGTIRDWIAITCRKLA